MLPLPMTIEIFISFRDCSSKMSFFSDLSAQMDFFEIRIWTELQCQRFTIFTMTWAGTTDLQPTLDLCDFRTQESYDQGYLHCPAFDFFPII